MGKGVSNHCKSEFSVSILISLFIILELNLRFLIVLQKVFKKTNSPPYWLHC